MKTIHRLTVRDYLGIRAIDLAPGKLTVLAGENGQGKSSILKAIRAAFAGIGEVQIRQGAESASIELDLGELTITRQRTATGTRLEVRDAAGAVQRKPQALLNAITGSVGALNPVALMRSQPREQRGLLLQALRLELPDDARESAVPQRDGEHPLEYLVRLVETLEERRRVIGQQGRDALGELRRQQDELRGLGPDDAVYPTMDDAQVQRLAAREQRARVETEAQAWDRASAAAVSRTTEMASAKIERSRLSVPDVVAADTAMGAAENEVTRLRLRVDDAEGDLARARAALVVAEQAETAAREAVSAARRVAQRAVHLEERIAELQRDGVDLGPRPDVEAVGAAVAAAEQAVRDATIGQQRATLQAAIAAAEADQGARREVYETATARISYLRDALPARLLAAAAGELEGVSVERDGLRWHGRPLEDCATSEQIRICLRIVQMLSGDLGVICVDGIEALSESSRSEVYAAIAEDPYQYVVTRVGTPGPGEVEVVDGEIRAGVTA